MKTNFVISTKCNILKENLTREGSNLTGTSIKDQNVAMYQEISEYEAQNKILLIEDNPGDARLVEVLLSESDLLDCKITNKTSLTDGMEAMEHEDFAVILLDLTLPDSRGFQTLR